MNSYTRYWLQVVANYLLSSDSLKMKKKLTLRVAYLRLHSDLAKSLHKLAPSHTNTITQITTIYKHIHHN